MKSLLLPSLLLLASAAPALAAEPMMVPTYCTDMQRHGDGSWTARNDTMLMGKMVPADTTFMPGEMTMGTDVAAKMTADCIK